MATPTQTTLNRWNTGYQVGITRDGRYSIYKLVGRWPPCRPALDCDDSGVINSAPGATNVVRVIAAGTTMRVIVNHVEVAATPVDASPSPYLSGQVGVGATYVLNGLGEVLKVDYAKLAPSLGPLKAPEYRRLSGAQRRLNREALRAYAEHPQSMGTPEQAPEMEVAR